jgi:NADH dehydrogenase/NADH:ubiquinone oxidoreductase subunit G
MVEITINGKIVKATAGEMLLDVLRREEIDVPALCDHKAIEPAGNCRLCMVEITRESWDGWKKYVTSCLYPVEEGLKVTTHSDELLEIRKNLLDLQLARSPESELVQKLAAEHGLHKSSFPTVPEPDNCIMCYACTRICETLGKSAIAAVMRGHEKVIAAPFGEEPPDCIGCLSCAHICPTDFIKWEDKDGQRTIWNKTFELIKCKQCGSDIITRDFADYIIEKRGLSVENFEICDACKRRNTAMKMGEVVKKVREVAL